MPKPEELRAEKKRLGDIARSRARTGLNAEVGELPPIQNPKRREACRLDLHKFLVEYFPYSTGLTPYGSDHLRLIQRLQVALLEGGRFANAVYRAASKTSISEGGAIWSTLYGHQKYVPVFAADAKLATGIVDSIKVELSENDLLTGDFPEVCAAFIHLGGKNQGARSQTYDGRLTHICWSTDRIVFPTIRLATPRDDIPVDATGQTLNSGAIIAAFGMTGSIRGLKHKRPDGTQQRPTFALCDDIQNDESAGSAMQVKKRMNLLRKTVLRAGGHRSSLGCVVNGTIIKPRDLMHQLTDHSLNPDFQSERIPLLHAFATAHKTLWLGEYKRLRTSYDAEVIGDQARAHQAATQFYLEHFEEMNAGAIPSWDTCFNSTIGELSAVQHAYNILIDDGEEVFASECQQDPLEESEHEGAVILSPKEITSKLNRYEEFLVPAAVTDLTGMIDVHEDLLFWLVGGFARDFTGFLISYGAWPSQRQLYYTLGDAQRPLRDQYPGMSLEGMIWAGLRDLTNQLCEREWQCADGSTTIRLSKLLIDANWGKSTKTIYEFCRQSPHKQILLPSHGHFIGASSRPMIEYTKRPGEVYGPGWQIPVPGQHPVRHVTFDSNYWKTFVHNRIGTPFGQNGCLSLFGDNPKIHEMLADHWTAEYFVPTTARGRTVDEWKIKAHNPDNHLFDCIVGTLVAASIQGCRLGEVSGEQRKTRSGKPRTLMQVMGGR